MQTFYNALTVINFILVAYFVYSMIEGNREEQREKEFDLGWGELKKEVRSERKKAAQKNTDKATVVRRAKATKAKAPRKSGAVRPSQETLAERSEAFRKDLKEKKLKALRRKAEEKGGRDVLTIHKIQRRKKAK